MSPVLTRPAERRPQPGLGLLARALLGATCLVLAACAGDASSPMTEAVDDGPWASSAAPDAVHASPAARSPGPFPPACTETGQTWVSPTDGVTLVCVPAGAFMMGTDPGSPTSRPASEPRHEVRLDAYWIDRTEVTNAAFERCVVAGRCPARSTVPGATGVASRTVIDYYHDPSYADHPVLVYTPEEAMAYCACMGRRLPTEAEWERAAGDPDGRRFPWGDSLDCDHASYLGCTADTTRVDEPLAGASAAGALNMAGNVAEWVGDYWAEGYASAPAINPTGPAGGTDRVRRGGGVASLGRDLAVTARSSGAPAHYFDGQMGFRCAVASPGGLITVPSPTP